LKQRAPARGRSPTAAAFKTRNLIGSAPEDQAAIGLMDRVSSRSSHILGLAGRSGSGPRATGALRIFSRNSPDRGRPVVNQYAVSGIATPRDARVVNLSL